MEYISHEGFKGMMSRLQASSPKGLLKEMHSMDHDGPKEFQKLPADLKSSGMNEDLTGMSSRETEEENELGRITDAVEAIFVHDGITHPSTIDELAEEIRNAWASSRGYGQGNEIDFTIEYLMDWARDQRNWHFSHGNEEPSEGTQQDNIWGTNWKDWIATAARGANVKEGNAFTAGLAKTKKGGEFKVDGKSVKDTSNYDSSMKESHPANDQWHEDFQTAILAMGLAGEAEARVMKALDHTDPLAQYGNMPAVEAAKEFVDDLGIDTSEPGDYDDYDADYEEPRDDFDMAGDFNDGEFWEAEVKKMQEIAGIRSQDDGPEDDDDEAREAKAKKAEMDAEEAENAEKEDFDEGIDPNAAYHGSTRNQGDTGSTIEFKVTDNNPKYFDIDYVIIPNSKYRQSGAGSRSPREKEYGSTRINKTNSDGSPLKDWEKQSIMVRGEDFSIGKLGIELYGDTKEDMPGFGGTFDALDKLSIREDEEGKPNMHSDRDVAKIVAQKHGKELRDLIDIYDTRSDADHKVRNQAWKDFENAAINWAGHEMLEAGMKKVVVRNLLSAYGYFEDWVPDYLDALKGELRGMEEGLNEFGGHGDASDNPKLQAAVKYLVQNRDRFLTQDYFFPNALSSLSLKSHKELYDYVINNWHSDEVYDVVAHMKSQIEKDMYANTDPNIADPIGDMEEGLHMPPLQATGASIQTVEEVTNETNHPYGFSVLSPDERKQLKEYVESLKTIKKEIGSLLEKAGKSSMMENDKAGFVKGGEIKNVKKAHDSKVPAATKAKYQEPSHKSKPGGNRTGLVMTKAEMWEGENHETIEASLGDKLHTALHKVTGMAIQKLVADGWNPDEAINFLQHEIEEKGREAVMAQHDPY